MSIYLSFPFCNKLCSHKYTLQMYYLVKTCWKQIYTMNEYTNLYTYKVQATQLLLFTSKVAYIAVFENKYIITPFPHIW